MLSCYKFPLSCTVSNRIGINSWCSPHSIRQSSQIFLSIVSRTGAMLVIGQHRHVTLLLVAVKLTRIIGAASSHLPTGSSSNKDDIIHRIYSDDISGLRRVALSRSRTGVSNAMKF